MLFGGLGMPAEIAPGFGAADRLEKLGAGRRRLGDDVELFVAPVRRHLPSAGTGIVNSPEALQQLLIRSHAQSEAERPVAIIRIEPVVARLQKKPRNHVNGFMTRAGNLEEYLLLPLEQNFTIVKTPRKIHEAINIDQLRAGQPFVSLFSPRRRIRYRCWVLSGFSLGYGHGTPLVWLVRLEFSEAYRIF